MTIWAVCETRVIEIYKPKWSQKSRKPCWNTNGAKGFSEFVEWTQKLSKRLISLCFSLSSLYAWVSSLSHFVWLLCTWVEVNLTFISKFLSQEFVISSDVYDIWKILDNNYIGFHLFSMDFDIHLFLYFFLFVLMLNIWIFGSHVIHCDTAYQMFL